MANKGNTIATGNSTIVWINGESYPEFKGFEYKVSLSFEDVKFAGGDNDTYSRYTGGTCEGTITLNKVRSRAALLIADAARTGIMPDISIVSKIMNDSTGKAERATFSNVIFTEYGATSEAGAVMEESIPFKSSMPKFTEYM